MTMTLRTYYMALVSNFQMHVLLVFFFQRLQKASEAVQLIINSKTAKRISEQKRCRFSKARNQQLGIR